MTHSGSLSEENFKETVKASFPLVDHGDIVIVADGSIVGRLGNFGPLNFSQNNKSVVWKGSFYDLGGYANMNREICLRLLHRGFAVKTEILKTAPQVDAVTMGMINALGAVRLPNENSCPLIIGFTPMPVQARGRRVIFYTMMETQGLHPSFVDRCNKHATEIWVPCKFYLDVFKEYGIVKPTHLLPLGVNEKIYHPAAKEPALRYEDILEDKIVDHLPKKFRFMSLFGWSYRKGPDALCRSFIKEFDAGDDACLVIYSRYAGGSGEKQKEHVRNEIRQYYKEIGKERPPSIFYCGDPIPISDLPGCFAAANCFVFCSRGEGFGLPVVEAGACEIPVISTYNTAMTEYLDDDVAFLVRSEEVATANDKLTWITEYYRDQLFPVLGDKEVAEIGRLMRLVCSSKKEADGKAAKFKERILKSYTWDVCADRVVERLQMK